MMKKKKNCHKIKDPREFSTILFISALFVMVKNWKQPKCPPVGEWLNCGIHTIEYYTTVKRDKLLIPAT